MTKPPVASAELVACPMSEGNEFACPNCDGIGETRGPEIGMPYYPCRFCEGEGVVTQAKADDWYFADPGDYL